MNDIPENLKFTKTHEWVKKDEDEITLGITAHAQELLGDLVYVELPEVGNKISSGDELGVVESVKAASDFYAPISGVVVAVNHKVSEDPALVNQAPYGEGWLVKIKPDNPDEIDELLGADEYQEKTKEDE